MKRMMLLVAVMALIPWKLNAQEVEVNVDSLTAVINVNLSPQLFHNNRGVKWVSIERSYISTLREMRILVTFPPEYEGAQYVMPESLVVDAALRLGRVVQQEYLDQHTRFKTTDDISIDRLLMWQRIRAVLLCRQVEAYRSQEFDYQAIAVDKCLRERAKLLGIRTLLMAVSHR